MLSTDYRVKLAAAEELAQLNLPLKRLSRVERRVGGFRAFPLTLTAIRAQRSKVAPQGFCAVWSKFGNCCEKAWPLGGRCLHSKVRILDACLLTASRFMSEIAKIIRNNLDTEGIFRVCGSAARMREEQVLLLPRRELTL